jgi:histidyl-tRNA synthetase
MQGLAVARDLASSGISAPTEVTGRSLKAGLKWAGKIGATVAVIIGESEIADGVAIVRNLSQSEQERVTLEEISEHVAELIGAGSE